MAFSGSVGQNASGEGVIEGENVWNISDGYTKIKILKPLIEINLYETIAKFGKQNSEDPVLESEIPYKRVEGFDRLMFVLRQLISNCMFQIDKEDKVIIKGLVERIDTVEAKADAISTLKIDDVRKEEKLIINEEHFRNSLDILSNIAEELNPILNRAGLIFRRDDITDIDDFMASIYEG